MRALIRLLVVATLTLVAVSCREKSVTPALSDGAASTNVQTYAVRGVIKELKPDRKTVVIKHEEVPNYMPAMTMPFEVKDAKELDGLQPGDEVSFRMLVTATDGWIDQVAKVGTSTVPEPKPQETFRQVRIVEPLNVGDPLPDYPFTNELDQAISLHQFKGKALAFTFIFTRCPFPNFCPRMSENFGDAYRKLTDHPDGAKNWHLLSISFDPEFDTPAVLRNYARKYSYDTNHWSFVTGALIEIDAITEQFGLVFPRVGANFDHNLRTVVVDAQGRVQKVFIGNEWTADELVAEMIKAAAN